MKKKTFCQDGYDYPKEKILEIIKTFGFYVDLDRWTQIEKPKFAVDPSEGYLRIKHPKFIELGSFIIHKHHLESNVHQEKIYLEELFQNQLIRYGEIKLKQKIHSLLSLENEL